MISSEIYYNQLQQKYSRKITLGLSRVQKALKLLKEPHLNIYNTKEKTKIDVKNIDVNVKNIIRNEKLLKVTKVDVNRPNIAVTLPKTESTKETKKAKKVDETSAQADNTTIEAPDSK